MKFCVVNVKMLKKDFIKVFVGNEMFNVWLYEVVKLGVLYVVDFVVN